jgi:transcriptional regulator with XRE-family HTH domain
MPEPTASKPSLAAILKARREAKGLTVEQAAKLAGMSADDWRKWERPRDNWRSELTIIECVRMANALEIGGQEFLDAFRA